MEWNLCGFRIAQLNEDEYWWSCDLFTVEKDKEKYYGTTHGKAFIENDTVLLGDWKLLDDDKVADVRDLPLWDKTIYFSKIDDFGKGILCSCMTGNSVADLEVLEKQKPVGYKVIGLPTHDDQQSLAY